MPIYGLFGGAGSQVLIMVGQETAPFTKLLNCGANGALQQIPFAEKLHLTDKSDKAGLALLANAKKISPEKYAETVAGNAAKIEGAGFPELAGAFTKAGAKAAKFAPVASKALGVGAAVYMVFDAATQTYICYQTPE